LKILVGTCILVHNMRDFITLPKKFTLLIRCLYIQNLNADVIENIPKKLVEHFIIMTVSFAFERLPAEQLCVVSSCQYSCINQI
jgi:hypothetical protein